MAYMDVLPGGRCPQIQVMFDYQSAAWSSARQWTDITPYVVSYTRQPVRATEFDQPPPAGGSITLRNDDARFLPDNASGPYFGGLKPQRPVQIQALWAGVTYARFQGFIVDWPQSWSDAGRNQSVTVEIVDETIAYQSFDLQGQSFAQKLSGASIIDILTLIGYFGTGSIDTGLSTIVASGVLGANSYAGQRIKDIAATENGVAFGGRAGGLVFHDRAHRVKSTNTRSASVQATIGDSGGAEIPYIDPTPKFGDVWPVVQVTPAGGSVQVATGSTAYFPATLNFPTGGQYLDPSALSALAAAQYLANRYTTPKTRVNAATLIGMAAPALWPTILTLDVSDRVVFNRRFLNRGAPAGTLSLTQFVEGFGDEVQIGKDWRVTLTMSPADIQTYWALGVTNYDELGVNTKLFY